MTEDRNKVIFCEVPKNLKNMRREEKLIGITGNV